MKETMHTHILATEHQSFAAGKTVARVWHGLSRRVGACSVMLLAAAVLLSPTQPASAEDALKIDEKGNVGIGTTTPEMILDVKEDGVIGTSATSTGGQHDEGNQQTKVSFGYQLSGQQEQFTGMRTLVAPGTHSCGNTADIRFDTWECNVAGSREVMRINGSGNVGIGTDTPGARLEVNGNVKASGKISGVGMVPPGAIVMFSGTTNGKFDSTGTGLAGTEYAGWQICNGNGGAPNLQGRFIVGVGPGYKLNQTGGAAMVTLSRAQMPVHNHGRGEFNRLLRLDNARGSATEDYTNHQNRPDVIYSNTIASAGGNQAHENRPPYYALAYIMRLP